MVFLDLKEFQDLCLDKIIHIVRQHRSYFLHKQARRHEVGLTVVNPDLALQEAGDSQGLPHSRPAECGSRQAIEARTDHPTNVVSASRGLPVEMHPVALITNRPICNKIQQQVTAVHVTNSRPQSGRSVYLGRDWAHMPSQQIRFWVRWW